MNEKEQKEQVLQEKLAKRAAIVTGILRKFIGAFYTARQQMLDAARAAEVAKVTTKGEKKGKAKQAADAKAAAGQAKKQPPTFVQQAWFSFLSDMDERISKQKRVTLDDMYRGVAALDAKDQALLSSLLLASTNKVLPASALNISQLNIKEAVQAASSACHMAAAAALPEASTPGLARLQDRGASCQQLLQYGYTQADAMRVGYPCHAVVDASQHHLPELRAAGVGVAELVGCPDTQHLAAHLTQGLRGVQDLKQAGYNALDMVRGGLSNPWTLAAAGFNAQELRDAGLSNKQLQLAGLAPPAAQPAAFLAQGMRAAAHHMEADLIPILQEGTQGCQWLTTPAAATKSAMTASGMASALSSPRRAPGSVLAHVQH